MSGRAASAAQRRIIAAAEDVTGRITGSERQLEALARLGLAFRHSRPPHAYFLTPAGHRLREELMAEAPEAADRGEQVGSAGEAAGVFRARTGDAGDPIAGPGREREVRSAWQGLLELRRMTQADGTTDRPCDWERSHLVQAAALALEAAGCRPAGSAGGAGPGIGGVGGYRVVAETAQPEAVGVRWIYQPEGPDGLGDCAAALEGAGWQVSEHAERGGGRWLLASPRRI